MDASEPSKVSPEQLAAEREAMREIWRYLRAQAHVRLARPRPARRLTPSPGTAQAIARRTRSRSPVFRAASRDTDTGLPCTRSAAHAPARPPAAPPSGRDRACVK